MRHTGEPSVEEILESIKKVIARDNRVSAADERREREERGRDTDRKGADEEDVLDLAAIGAYADDEDDEPASESPLIKPGTANSISESLAALAVLAEPGAAPQIVRSGETSLEGLVRELLRPALAEWLDKNLPPLVEHMVAVEIARIVGKKG
jgi:cell pole-organizing protein PopZ